MTVECQVSSAGSAVRPGSLLYHAGAKQASCQLDMLDDAYALVLGNVNTNCMHGSRFMSRTVMNIHSCLTRLLPTPADQVTTFVLGWCCHQISSSMIAPKCCMGAATSPKRCLEPKPLPSDCLGPSRKGLASTDEDSGDEPVRSESSNVGRSWIGPRSNTQSLPSKIDRIEVYQIA